MASRGDGSSKSGWPSTTANDPILPLSEERQKRQNGKVARMNCTIKDATVKRFHYDTQDQLRTHLADFMTAFNFARRLKTLNGLTSYEYICKIWTSEPERLILYPIHPKTGLKNLGPDHCPIPLQER